MSGITPMLMPGEDPAGKIVYVVILAAVLIVCYVSLVTLLAALLRGPTERSRTALQEHPWVTLAYGLVGWLVFGALAALLYSWATTETEIIPGMMAAAVMAIIIPVFICLLGAPGLYTHIGGRIAALRNRETSDLHRVILGCTLALVAGLFPGIGWFIVMPLLLASELGAGIQALRP